MKINQITIGGITNIGEAVIDISNICALVAPNNYGKSNVLSAISFGINFIRSSAKQKELMMNSRLLVPINSIISAQNFKFVLTGELEEKNIGFAYSFEFRWATESAGGCIVKEEMSYRETDAPRYKSLILRDFESSALFQNSPKGRCNKTLAIEGNELALNKLCNFDDLFCVNILREIEATNIQIVNTLENPDSYFSRNTPTTSTTGYSVAFPEQSLTSFYIYSLKELMPDKYALLRDAVLSLLPNIEDFEPVQINLKKEGEKPSVFVVDDVIYDIRVKEKYNTQYTSINRVSSGCKRILYVLALTIAAEINHIPLITFEELENSVHPRLLQNLLITIGNLAGDTKIMLTSHSPFFVKYLNPKQIYLGIPNQEGIADFRMIKSTKVKKLVKMASAEEISLGEYIFEFMLDLEEDRELITEYFG